MLRSSLISASALLLCATASAQDTLQITKTGPIKNAGVYHVASKTWTRHPGGAANLGPDTVYSNDAGSGYFWWDPAGGWGGGTDGTGGGPRTSEVVDEGRLPRTYNGDGVPWIPQGSGTGAAGATGDPGVTLGTDRSSYDVNGFQFAYCTDDLGVDIDWHFDFIESYTICNGADSIDVSGSMHTRTGGIDGAGIDIDGAAAALPGGSGVLGSFACWIVTIDLANTTGKWMVEGDGGDQNWDGSFVSDNFGWEHSMSGVLCSVPTTFDGLGAIVTQGTFSGPIMAGDPAWVFRGEGTYYNNPANVGPGAVGGVHLNPVTGVPAGTGLGNDFDAFLWNNGPGAGCYWFGGYANNNGPFNPQSPPGDFWFDLYGEAAGGVDFLGTVDTACATVPNSTGVRTRIALTGDLGTTCDLDRLAFRIDRMPANQFGYLAFSTANGSGAGGGGGISSGSGKICTLPLKRLQKSRRANENGVAYAGTPGSNAPYFDPNNPGGPGFNNPKYDTCNDAPILSVGGWTSGNTYYFQWWHRDGATWNFSDLRCVTF
jgi:hypothetical protein